MRNWLSQWTATKARNRYGNCRYWRASVVHALFHALVNPAHANRNLVMVLAGRLDGNHHLSRPRINPW